MNNIKLKDRIDSYQDASDYKLLNKLPVIITVNGRSFSKITNLLNKPFCPKFAECIFSTTLRLCNDIEGAFFAYQHNDEITLVLRNDQNVDTSPWFDNKLQKICSVASSIATLHFNDCANSINLELTSDPIFTAKVFTVPNIMEAINTIIYKQQHNFHMAIQLSCFYELLKKYDKNTIKEMLMGLSIDQKIDLLNQECNINFNEYPISFKRGVAAYKKPKMIDGVLKNKWFLDSNLSIFTKDQSFLSNIFRMGDGGF